MTAPPLTNSFKVAVVTGGAVGAVFVGALAFSRLSLPWGVVALLIGALLGAVGGLDMLLPGYEGVVRIRGRLKRPTPFSAGAGFLGITILAAIFGYYIKGSLFLDCRRAEATVVQCSRVTRGWNDSAETSRADTPLISSAIEGRPGQIVTTSPDGERGFIEGFDAGNLAALNDFIKSSEPTLLIRSDSLWYAHLVLWSIAALTLLLGSACLARGTMKLRKYLASTAI